MHFPWTCIVIIPQAYWIMLICLPSFETLGHKKLHAEFQYKTSNISNTYTVYHNFKKIKFLSWVLAQRWMTTIVNLTNDDRWIRNTGQKCVCACVCACGIVYHLKQTTLLSHLCSTTCRHDGWAVIRTASTHFTKNSETSPHSLPWTPHCHTPQTHLISYHEWQSHHERLHSTFWTQKWHISLNTFTSLTD
jgi:hypothetical protein